MAWKNQLRIRPKFIFAVTLILIAAWIICAQPIFFTSHKRQTARQASPSNLKNHVKTISENFYPRDYKNVGNLNRTADYIKTQLQQFSLDVSEQNYSAENREYKNVIAKFGSPGKPVLVIGAHYDSCGKHPAADDNASGVAGLIELARLLKDQSPVNIAVELVAYSTEEPPIFGSNDMGSFVHAQRLKAQKIDVVGMLSLEMIGYFSDEWGSQDFPAYLMRLFYPSKGNFIAVVSNFSSYSLTRQIKQSMQLATDLPVYSMNGPGSLYGIDYSDHRNYWEFEFPAVMITDTAFLRNKAYHTDQDTFDRLNYEKMSKVIDAVYGSIFSFK